METAPPPRTIDRRHAFLLLGVVALVAAAWSPSLLNDYTLDDNTFVRAVTPHGPNPMVQELRPLGEYFTRPYGHGVASVTRGFRPVTVLSYAVTHRVVGQPVSPPWVHLLLNLLLQLLATCLISRLIGANSLPKGVGWPEPSQYPAPGTVTDPGPQCNAADSGADYRSSGWIRGFESNETAKIPQ